MLLNRFYALQKVNESINMLKRVFQFFLVLSGTSRDEKNKMSEIKKILWIGLPKDLILQKKR